MAITSIYNSLLELQTRVTAPTYDTVTALPDLVAGASTAAAGSASTDFGALPAGTGNFYPVTAADDATGVGIHANEAVAGRLLYIGNGVSNKILKIYPPTGGTINGAAANAAYSTASGKGAILYCRVAASGGTWYAWG